MVRAQKKWSERGEEEIITEILTYISEARLQKQLGHHSMVSS